MQFGVILSNRVHNTIANVITGLTYSQQKNKASKFHVLTGRLPYSPSAEILS